MGRETKIMLALLATLAGVFVGVLSMKLLVPRPPTGTGPDVHVETAAVEPHELVSPPSLSTPPPAPATGDRYQSGSSGFVLAGRGTDATPPRRDPFVTAASLEQPLPPSEQPIELPAAMTADETASSPTPTFTPPVSLPNGDGTAIEPPGMLPASTAAIVRPAMPSTPTRTHVAAAGDSWWNLAEQAYGDGRFYRALFAWNRVVDPRVSLTPGTPLEIPPRERLEAAWPRLMPPR